MLNKIIYVYVDMDRSTSYVFVNASSLWSTQLHVEMSPTSRYVRMCYCVEAALLLRLWSSLWDPEPRSTIHQHRHSYGKQEEWDESRLHDQWGCCALFTLAEKMFWIVCWQQLEEEKVQQLYLNRGLINWLTHLPKWPKSYLLVHS